MCEEESVKYLRDLIREKEEVEKNGKDILAKILSQEIVRVREGGRPPGKDTRLLDVYNEKPVKVTAKVLVPVKEHPRFNFVGKLLGPKGNSLKGLQEETMTKMAVLGKGSMKDKLKEQQLRNSSDPKHSHLQEDLHVEITAFSSPAEAHARVAYALSCVRKYMIPDSNDEIRQNQMREIQILKKLETSEDTASDVMAVSKDSGNESDASNSPPPNNSSTNTTHHQTNSSSSPSSSNLLNNNSLPHSHPISHSHSYVSHSHSHPDTSISHTHPNHSLSRNYSNISPNPPNVSPELKSSNGPLSQNYPNPPHLHSNAKNTPIYAHSKHTSILNKIIIQRYASEENTSQAACCEQSYKNSNHIKSNQILDMILPGSGPRAKRDISVSMDYEYTHPDYTSAEEPSAKKCK